MKIITSGYPYIDIDAFACIYVYKELLDLMGEKSECIITSNLNSSITEKYKNLDFYKKNSSFLDDLEEKEYIIMDTSDYNHFEEFVELKKVSKIFDHHPGFEKFWKEKLGKNSQIEHIGAAATLIYREYKKANMLDKISKISAEILAVAILSNTLYFKADISTIEDEKAYEDLKNYFDYSESFEKDYFLEVQNNIEKDFLNSLKNDTKILDVNGKNILIGQLEVWDAEKIIYNHKKEIKEFLNEKNKEISFLNLIEIGKNRNIIICRDKESLDFIKKYFPEFNYNFKKYIAITPNVILRKEILKRIL